MEADDISRRLQNLTALFDEDDEDVQLATRVGLVMLTCRGYDPLKQGCLDCFGV